MLWHSAANCKVSKFSSLFCIFLRNYWSDLDQTFDFCLCCATLQPIVKFQNFLTFLHFSEELLVFMINIDFCSCCGILQPVAKFHKFLSFWHFSQELLVWSWSNLWFLFMLCHSTANCKVSKFSHFFAFFWRNYWSDLDQTLIFVHAVAFCSQLQSFTNFSVFGIFPRNYWFHLDQTLIFVYAVALCSHLQSFQIFFTFLHFSQELLVWSWSNFDFCLCCGTLQPIVKFQNFLTFCIFLRNYWSDLDQTLIFVHAVVLCSQFQSFSVFYIVHRIYWFHLDKSLIFVSCCATLQPIVKFQNFFTFLHFSEELLVFIKLWFLFMLWHSAASCKVSQISQFLAFFPGTTGLILIKLWFLFMLCHSAATYNFSKFSSLFCIFLRNYWSDLDQTLIFVYAVAFYSQL